MNGVHAYNQYRQTSVQTSSREKLLLMLYDGAIKYLNLAVAAIEKNNVPERHQNIIKTQAIIEELMSTLNMDYEISRSLYSLYDYFLHRLVEANVGNDRAMVKEVLEMLSQLRDGWAEAATSLTSRESVPPRAAGISVKG